MTVSFWLRRFLVIFVGAFALLSVVYWARGRTIGEASIEAGIWSAVTAAVFIAARLYHSSKGRRCALCRDMPEDNTAGVSGPSGKSGA